MDRGSEKGCHGGLYIVSRTGRSNILNARIAGRKGGSMPTLIIDEGHYDWPDKSGLHGTRMFRTLSAAKKAGQDIGWPGYHVIKLNRRFESGYIVAQWLIGGQELYGITFDAFRYPTFKYANNYGVQRMTVLTATAKTARPWQGAKRGD